MKVLKLQTVGDWMAVRQETHLWLQYAEDALRSCVCRSVIGFHMVCLNADLQWPGNIGSQ